MREQSPRIVVAPDKFKGSLTAPEVADALITGIHGVLPRAETMAIPMADGGEGTAAAALRAGYMWIPVRATGPDGHLVLAGYALHGKTALVEVASASGLNLFPHGRVAPLQATSRGTGELIAHAIRAGARRVVLAAGGSGCTDGGAGLLQALGAVIVDVNSHPIEMGGAALLNVAHIDLSVVRKLVNGVEVVLASDVDNPLIGPTGAAHVYGAQKGADAEQRQLLDNALIRWADILSSATGTDARWWCGAGAAGGIGYAAISALNASRRAGVDIVMELSNFENALADTDLVVTGEGRFDHQSLNGKAPIGVARAATRRGIPVVVVCGTTTLTARTIRDAGIAGVYSLEYLEPDLSRSMSAAAELLNETGGQLALNHAANISGARKCRPSGYHPS